MKEDQMELNGLIQKVMEQMDERRYGKKIITRYRSSFLEQDGVSPNTMSGYFGSLLIFCCFAQKADMRSYLISGQMK